MHQQSAKELSVESLSEFEVVKLLWFGWQSVGGKHFAQNMRDVNPSSQLCTTQYSTNKPERVWFSLSHLSMHLCPLYLYYII